MYIMGAFAGMYVINGQLAKFRPKKKLVLPKEEQEFVDSYIAQVHRDKDVPAWIKGMCFVFPCCLSLSVCLPCFPGDRDYVPKSH